MKQRKAARKTGLKTRTAPKAAPKRKTARARKVARPAAARPTRPTAARAARKSAPGAARKSASRAARRAADKAADQAAQPIALPAECAIASAADLRGGLLKHLAEAGNVQIDASAVQRIDTASLQVLAAFARDRRAGGLPVEWLGVPACLTEAATLLNLTDVLGFASPAAG